MITSVRKGLCSKNIMCCRPKESVITRDYNEYETNFDEYYIILFCKFKLFYVRSADFILDLIQYHQ